MATTKTKKPRKPTQPDRVRQSLRDWQSATMGVLEGVREIVVDILEELENCRSPFHEFIRERRELMEFLSHIDDADSSLTFILARESKTVAVNIPNPVDAIRKK